MILAEEEKNPVPYHTKNKKLSSGVRRKKSRTKVIFPPSPHPIKIKWSPLKVTTRVSTCLFCEMRCTFKIVLTKLCLLNHSICFVWTPISVSFFTYNNSVNICFTVYVYLYTVLPTKSVSDGMFLLLLSIDHLYINPIPKI